tara:strand:- start:566 stop:1339 length:774 start_codon:yes stop_codon:yes gene_type:complete
MKYQIGYSREFSPKFFDSEGKSEKIENVNSIETYRVAFALRLSNRLVSSLSLPLKKNNFKDLASHQSIADPTLSLTWNFLNPNYVDSLLPQLDFKLAVKAPLALSRHDSSLVEETHYHSNGFWEVSPAAQAWFYFGQVTLGSSYEFIWRNTRQKALNDRENTTIHPGFVHRMNVSLLYSFVGTGQITAALQREYESKDRIEDVYTLDKVRYEASLAGSLKVGLKKTLTLSYSQNAPFLTSQNTPFYKTLSLAYIQSI